LERALCNMYMKCECKCNGFESFLQRLFLIFSHEFKIASQPYCYVLCNGTDWRLKNTLF
jgi:hypothetical protein